MENKVYLITGASSDIGIAFLKNLEETLKKEGQRAVVFAHYGKSADRLLGLQNETEALQLFPVQADLSEPEDVERLIKEVKEKGECPDYILHLPAAKLHYAKLKQLSVEEMQTDMAIQVYSLAEIAKTFLPLMAKKKSGKVVAMLSAVTLGMPPRFMSQYVTVKYALLGLIKSMAMEYADKGITVNGISPNMMETRFLEEIDERIVEMNKESCTMKRNVKVEEAVAAIQFLFSHGADYTNGVNFNMTGGDR